MAFFLVFLASFFGLCIFSTSLLRWNQVKYNNKNLPPGTMGWPLFGETTEFLKLGPSFMKNQRARYGSFFKSHILGCPTIVSMDAELKRYNEAKGLVPGYPQRLLDIQGKCNIAAVNGSAHKYRRGALLSHISPTRLRDQLLPKIRMFTRSHLSNWERKVMHIQEKTKEMAFLSSCKQIAGIESSSSAQEFMPEFFKQVQRTLSLPIDLPNTNYHRGFQARKIFVRLRRTQTEERRGSKQIHQNMLGYRTKTEANRFKSTEAERMHGIITLLYSGTKTVSTTSRLAEKYLHDHPKVQEELKEEHMAIREKKKPEDPIDYNDYKAMRFTRADLLETSRFAREANGVRRKTTRDMERNGYIIPGGWRIYVYTREGNYDPRVYPEPYTFNPWRWMDRSQEHQNSFELFGGGTRQCPGKELGDPEISTFLHYFVTKYRWEEVGGEPRNKFPRVPAPNGLLRIRVSTH
uniref:CYP85A n=1 Tax=Withania somnifera TaxID=126910 RepID=A0A4V1I1U9_9SOLA|nr:CYP85A [Withania somnifera]